MSVLDIVVLAGLLASMLLGAWRGLAYEVMSLLNWKPLDGFDIFGGTEQH